MDNRMLTAEGLKNLFWGEIIAICAVIPLLGTIAGIVGMVLSILGFVKLSRVSSLYQMAFAFEVASSVLRSRLHLLCWDWQLFTMCARERRSSCRVSA